MRALIQLRPATDVIAAVADPGIPVTAGDIAGELPEFVLDHTFAPCAVPGVSGAEQVVAGDSVVVRGEIPDRDLAAVATRLSEHPDVAGVFADPRIQTCPTCGGDSAVGDSGEVRTLLRTGDLAAAGMDGGSVALAVVDTGINAAQVRKVLGGEVTIDTVRSWNPPGVQGRAGEFPVDHGSMCAFDALLSAPRASLLDIPVLRSRTHGETTMDGLLSDALAAYAHLRTVLIDQPEASRALVVSNSWGAFSPEWDFPVGQPGNYSDNPSHPFNVIVGSLEATGADILFAAGNCGRDCPDSRCAYREKPITGANSHPQVLSIGGADIHGRRVGYSSQGPGRLADRKPDICGYTHFLGSKAFGPQEPDTGTSAACPVTAGLVAAIRTVYSASVLPPARLRSVLQTTATARPDGYDYDYGYGVVDAAAVLKALKDNGVRA
ncbi:S8 family serine peptidase [Nocardia vermiculata]|uniref:S8 family peptidase n=1 Tax=Nocardia vermiculata TaxID=257274 RepID=A0A846Y2W4_9NOCA|nr:S8 family serine peptidase [Nocardia vermiculata]NKY53856.1 S8 family peptidase [Nocardia vermiculata]